jgi:hypothetical protein
VYTSLFSPIRDTCPAYLIPLDLITRTTLGEEYGSLSSSLCSFLHSLSGERYGIMASLPSFRIPPESLSSLYDLFSPIAASLFLMIIVLTAKGLPAFVHCIAGCYAAAKYRRIVKNDRFSLFYRICNEPTISTCDRRNIFPISFTPLTYL